MQGSANLESVGSGAALAWLADAKDKTAATGRPPIQMLPRTAWSLGARRRNVHPGKRGPRPSHASRPQRSSGLRGRALHPRAVAAQSAAPAETADRTARRQSPRWRRPLPRTRAKPTASLPRPRASIPGHHRSARPAGAKIPGQAGQVSDQLRFPLGLKIIKRKQTACGGAQKSAARSGSKG